MKRPERPEALFAVLVIAGAMLLSGGTAQAATAANGNAVSGSGKSAGRGAGAGEETDESASPASLRKQLKKLAAEYEKSEDKLDHLTKQQAKLGGQVTATKRQYTSSRDRVARTARIAYTGGPSSDPIVAMASNDDPTKVAQRMTSLSLLSKSDGVAMRDAGKERKRLSAQQGKLKKAKKGATAERTKIAKQRKQLNEKLDEAARKLAERRNGGNKASRSPKMSGDGACPVGEPVQISDTWGAGRGGGRSHEGTDMLAPMGTPTYAVESGTISRAGSDGLGGIVIILNGKSGQSYYYAHHSANAVSSGAKVVAGQQIGKVGMSGNAQGTVPHLHFERWPDGSNPVNPYPLVQSLCG